MLALVSFIAGMSAGIALHRAIMAFILCKAPDGICSYCEWMDRRPRRPGGPKRLSLIHI